MRPPSRVTTVVILISFVLAGLATVGIVGSAITGTSTVEQTSSEPVMVENGSTYDVSQTLQFDVNSSNDTYEIRTESDAFVDMLSAEDGIVTLDTAGMSGGTYVLVHHDTGTVEYEFTLRQTETTTTSPTTTVDSATTVEDGGQYEIPGLLSFENLQEGDQYELRKGDDRAYVDQFQPTDSRIELATEGLDSGEYRLIHAESGEVTYQFTLEDRETTVEQTTLTTTPTTTQDTTEREPLMNRSTTSTWTETTTTTSTTSQDTNTDVTNSSSTTESRTTVANQNEGYYPSVPGFGFETGMLAFVSGGILLLRRYQ